MKRIIYLTSIMLGCILLVLDPGFLRADVEIGKPAPDFSGKDTLGKAHSLSMYKGKIVVLEWLNHQCPFVRKHYDGKKMQELQKTYRQKGIIWLSIISSAPGKQGYCTPEEADRLTEENGAAPTAVLLDPEGEIGHLYEAKTTPHMFIIDKNGELVYDGAIDDIRSARIDDLKTATNYVQKALDELLDGKKVSVQTSQPYGCSVKYK